MIKTVRLGQAGRKRYPDSSSMELSYVWIRRRSFLFPQNLYRNKGNRRKFYTCSARVSELASRIILQVTCAYLRLLHV